MKKILGVVILCTVFSFFVLRAQDTDKKLLLNSSVELPTQLDSVYYAFGVESALMSINSFLYSTCVIEDTRDIEDPRMVDAITRSNESNIEEYLSGAYHRLNNQEKSSDSEIYNLGYDDGEHLEYKANKLRKDLMIGDSVAYNVDAIIAGIGDILTRQPRRLNEDAGLYIAEILENRETEARIKELMEALVEKGEIFLTENAKRPEVVTLPSGLQYEVVVEGTGSIPTIENKVVMYVTMSFFDGRLLGVSSPNKEEALPLEMSEVPSVCQEVLLLMPAGSKWKLYTPYDVLGYTPACTFDIELIAIE